MARLPRLILPFQPHHIVQQGNNGLLIFREAADYTMFLGCLRSAARSYKVALHAYVLLPEQLQLLVSPSDERGLALMMQWIGRCYVPYFNQKYGRSGALWQGRYKTALLDAEHYFLLSSRYIELAPIYHGLAACALDYPWSSYAHHAGVRADSGLTDHPLYWALGNTPFEREAAYQAVTEQGLAAADIALLQQSVLKGKMLASDVFKLALEHKLKRALLPARRGRPFKRLPERDML